MKLDNKGYLLCVDTFKMETGKTAFKKGVIYPYVSKRGGLNSASLTNGYDNQKLAHVMSQNLLDKYFTKAEVTIPLNYKDRWVFLTHEQAINMLINGVKEVYIVDLEEELESLVETGAVVLMAIRKNDCQFAVEDEQYINSLS